MPKPPALILKLTLLVSAVVGLSALGGIALGVIGNDWFLAGFEAAVLVACAFGVLTGMGRYGNGPALAILCTAAAIFVGAVLSERALVTEVLQSRGDPKVVAGVKLMPFAAGRALAGLFLGSLAVITVLVRKPAESLGYVARGLLLLAPVVLIRLGWTAAPVRSALKSAPEWVQASLAGLAMLIGAVLLAVSLHCLIRALETGKAGAEAATT